MKKVARDINDLVYRLNLATLLSYARFLVYISIHVLVTFFPQLTISTMHIALCIHRWGSTNFYIYTVNTNQPILSGGRREGKRREKMLNCVKWKMREQFKKREFLVNNVHSMIPWSTGNPRVRKMFLEQWHRERICVLIFSQCMHYAVHKTAASGDCKLFMKMTKRIPNLTVSFRIYRL